MYYACLDNDGICIGIIETGNEIYANNYILIDSYDISKIGKKYVNNEWVDIPSNQQKVYTLEQQITDIMAALTDIAVKLGVI
jgi:hypothetical protein